jgi:hypothetical protein
MGSHELFALAGLQLWFARSQPPKKLGLQALATCTWLSLFYIYMSSLESAIWEISLSSSSKPSMNLFQRSCFFISMSSFYSQIILFQLFIVLKCT